MLPLPSLPVRRFRDLNPTLRGFLVIAAIAGIIFALNLERTLVSLSLILRIVFFLAIAVVVYMFWRDRLRLEIATWSQRAPDPRAEDLSAVF